MTIENAQRSGIYEEAQEWFAAHPKTYLATVVVVNGIILGIGAFVGYKQGVKKGEKRGEVKGYASALTDIGVTPAEVPTLSAAWRESSMAAKQAVQSAATV